MSASPPRHTFPRTRRLRRQADFARVHQSQVYAADDTLVIRASRSPHPTTRIGISLSRQVGNAVVRNRWKRWIREAYRRHQANLPEGLDLVVRPRKGARPEFPQVERSLRELILRLARRLERLSP